MTRSLCALQPGDLVGVRGPFGSRWPMQAGHGGDLVVVAGGIGLAPLRPAIEHLCAERERYDDVVVLAGSRTPDDRLYVDSYDDWRGFDIHFEDTVDTAPADWPGHVGVVTQLIRRAPFDAPETT